MRRAAVGQLVQIVQDQADRQGSEGLQGAEYVGERVVAARALIEGGHDGSGETLGRLAPRNHVHPALQTWRAQPVPAVTLGERGRLAEPGTRHDDGDRAAPALAEDLLEARAAELTLQPQRNVQRLGRHSRLEVHGGLESGDAGPIHRPPSPGRVPTADRGRVRPANAPLARLRFP